ncbi:MAG: nucleotidyltransferase family protein [Chloroflexi bacterium]|nr:nucleotidyltransferase family protein [Chloroflexota bacterium]
MTVTDLTTDALLAKLHALLPELRDHFGVNALWLFGSRVRGDARPDSDLDVLVEFDRAPSFFEYIALEDLLSEATSFKVDLVMKRALKPQIGRRILAEMIAV